jgi:glutamine synthetase adenylyltransferase
MALSSDVMVSVHKAVCAPVTAARQTAPLLPPVEALSALESAVAASLALDADKLSAGSAIAPSVTKQSDLSACIEELSQAIAGFVAHGSVGARLPRSAVVLGKAQSRLRALRKEAMARVALADLRAGASSNYVPADSSEISVSGSTRDDLTTSNSFSHTCFSTNSCSGQAAVCISSCYQAEVTG